MTTFWVEGASGLVGCWFCTEAVAGSQFWEDSLEEENHERPNILKMKLVMSEVWRRELGVELCGVVEIWKRKEVQRVREFLIWDSGAQVTGNLDFPVSYYIVDTTKSLRIHLPHRKP